jgi:hypothetical protein
VATGSQPTPGQILGTMTAERIDGKEYDRAWPARAEASLW